MGWVKPDCAGGSLDLLPMNTITLRPGKERSVLRRHPWLFESALARGGAEAGSTVRVEAHSGAFLGWAAFSPSSKIRLRIWSFDESERIDAEFFQRRIRAAVRLRARFQIASNGVRLIHGESDGLPGLVVDRYDDVLVAQFTSTGVERWREEIADALLAETGLTRLYERSDSGTRQLEGLELRTGWLRGAGDTQILLQENGWTLGVDVALGHKTGYYLDQRENRGAFSERVRRMGLKKVLNCYCYTGGFTVAALAGGAEQVLSIDSSATALEQAQRNLSLNGLLDERAEFWDADVNSSLSRLIGEGRRFDAIVLDPPKLAPSAAHVERAARAYKHVNRLAFRLLEPGGVLFTYSCSGGVNADLFQKIVASAAHEAPVDGSILARQGGAVDHPTSIHFPEGEYLKGLVVARAEA